MNLCSSNHDEICYDQKHCPLCEKIEENDDLENDLRKANDEISKLQDELSRRMP